MRQLVDRFRSSLVVLSLAAVGSLPSPAVTTPEATVQASGSASSGSFGFSVDLDEGTLIVGAPLEQIPGGASQDGAAYIFERETSFHWIQTARLPSPNQTVTRFGDTHAVSIDGDVAVVGAESPSGTIGQAYVYRNSGGTWSLEQTLNRPGSIKNGFGDAVAVRGTLVVVSDTQYAGAFGEGSLHFYRYDGASWLLEQEFFEPFSSNSELGFDIDIDANDDLLIAGAPGANNHAGDARIFRKTGAWTPEATLVPSDPETGAEFGGSAAIDGEWAVVGAERNQVFGAGGRGAAYIFRHMGGSSWVQTQKLVAPGLSTNARFGRSVAIDGDRIVVGASLDQKAWVYQRIGDTWFEVDRLEYASPVVPSQLGGAVALDSDVIAVGDISWSGPIDNGAVSIFQRAKLDAVYEASAGFLPQAACPDWAVTSDGGNASLTDRNLRIDTSASESDRLYYRADIGHGFASRSLYDVRFNARVLSGTSSSAGISHAQLQLSTAPDQGATLVLQDGTIGLWSSWEALGATAARDTSSGHHTYRVVVYPGGVVEVYYDAESSPVLTGSVFSDAGFADQPELLFGDVSIAAGGTADWRWIRHNGHRYGCSGRCVGDLSDDFEDGVIDPRWARLEVCGTLEETGGELVASALDTCSGPQDLFFRRDESLICGDYDLSVSYRLVDWDPVATGLRATGVRTDRWWNYDFGTNFTAFVHRYGRSTLGCPPSTGFETYRSLGSVNACGTSVERDTTDVEGGYRINRSGDVVTIYTWNGASWVQELSESNASVSPVRPALRSGTFAGLAAVQDARFDDLSLTSQAHSPRGGAIVDLRVGKAGGGDLSLTWGPSTAPGDNDSAIYAGTADDFTTYSPLACTTFGNGFTTITPASDSTFYLAVPRDLSVEGSYGQGSGGGERAASAQACAPQELQP